MVVDRKMLIEALRVKVKPSSQLGAKDDISEDLARSIVREIDNPCPQCAEKSIICCYADTSLGDPLNYYDNFCHVCMNPSCTYGVHTESRTMVGQETSEDGTCPFCRRNVFGEKCCRL